MKSLLKCLPLLILLALFSCKKENPNPEKLPPATQQGKNTFGCYINGEVWVPYAPTLFDRKITPVFGDWIRVETQRFENSDGSDKQEIVISFKPEASNEEKTYFFENGNASALFFSKTPDCDYFIENNLEGSITITKYDLQEKVLAGTFEFTLDKENCTTLHFTDGRFDIRIP